MLKALGASTASLVKDALGQALIVLVVGIGRHRVGLVAALGALAGTALPFLLSPLTTLLPGVIMIAARSRRSRLRPALRHLRRPPHRTREQPMITLDDITLTFPDGDSRVTAVDHVTLRRIRAPSPASPDPAGRQVQPAGRRRNPHPARLRAGVIDGRRRHALDPGQATELRRDSIGIVFQQSNLIPSLTAEEQLPVMNELGAPHAPVAAREVAARADELLRPWA